jgi:hypothetical protein
MGPSHHLWMDMTYFFFWAFFFFGLAFPVDPRQILPRLVRLSPLPMSFSFYNDVKNLPFSKTES